VMSRHLHLWMFIFIHDDECMDDGFGR